MSRFLAPIHSWLFNKIKMHEELEKESIKALRDKYKDNIDDILNNAYERFGLPLEGKPLEELIDTSNIHGWLQNRIEITETRQSYVLATVFKSYGKEAEDLIFRVYGDHGAECGRNAAENFDVAAAPQIYQAMNSYVLDGMPCDNVNNVSEKTDEKLVWKNSTCLHRGYWETAGADVDLFYKLRYTWIKNFIEGANGDFTFEERNEETNGRKTQVHEIIKK